ncbi:MAG: inosine/xanthosine triphosphatase [bacterium]|nr:inosine/xanthosine triphosphatase [bacterium]
MKVAVGSINPVKVNAVRTAVGRIFPKEKLVVDGISIVSGISDQPMSDSEAIKGARKRALDALKALKADFGFGLEGTVCEVEGILFLTNWVAVVDRGKRWGLAGGGRLELPKKISEEILKGERELGEIICEFSGLKNVKKSQGTPSILTKGLKNRTSEFENCCIDAMVRFINPQFYEEISRAGIQVD